jgi:hypothetical protein
MEIFFNIIMIFSCIILAINWLLMLHIVINKFKVNVAIWPWRFCYSLPDLISNYKKYTKQRYGKTGFIYYMLIIGIILFFMAFIFKLLIAFRVQIGSVIN